MKKKYGAKKGKKVFYASRNKGSIKGVERGKHQEDNVVANAMKTRKGMAVKPKAVKSNKVKKSSKSKSTKKIKYQEEYMLDFWNEGSKKKKAAIVIGAVVVIFMLCKWVGWI